LQLLLSFRRQIRHADAASRLPFSIKDYDFSLMPVSSFSPTTPIADAALHATPPAIAAAFVYAIIA
jgi:hypothetical protein